MRSNGVTRRRDLPSFGKRDPPVDCEEPDSSVTPDSREAKAYAAATRSGPLTCLTSTRAVELSTSETSYDCVDHAFIHFELRHRSVPLSPRFSGNRFWSGGSGRAV